MKQSYTRIVFSIVSLLLIVACEGPVGPMGPQGERGERGESGISSFMLIEERLDDRTWEENNASYVIRDIRIQPTTIAEIYVKRFYTSTGEAYYMTMIDFLLVRDRDNFEVDVDPPVVQVSSGLVRFYDPDQVLRNEIVAVAITLP